MLNSYLSGFGNIVNNDGREFKCSFRPFEAIQSAIDESSGWFGRVDADTHYLYMEYPCLAVFMSRIQNDLAVTIDPENNNVDWDLPGDIAPLEEDSGHPTQNLLGYHSSVVLHRDQRTFLNESGMDDEGVFFSNNNSLPLFLDLLINIQTELDHIPSSSPIVVF